MITIVIISIIGTILISVKLFFHLPKLSLESMLSIKIGSIVIVIYNLRLLFLGCLFSISISNFDKTIISIETIRCISIFLLIYLALFLRIKVIKKDISPTGRDL
jgi:hypothetical protein